MSRGYQDLIAWQKGMDFVEAVYRATLSLAPEEKFGLSSQLHRAAVSIPSNVAEGHSRSSDRDFARFLEIALGSVAEVETQLILTGCLQFISTSVVTKLLDSAAEIGRIITGLLRSKQ